MINYEQLSDAELTVLLQEGDRTAFTCIYHRYAEDLYRFAFNILKDENECTDAVQDIFVWLWHNHKKLQITVLKHYLLAAVKYKLTRVIQNSKRKAEILAAIPVTDELFVDDSLEVKELKAIIRHFLETLPPRAREIFHLSRYEYLSNKEIAVRLNISEKTVENQLTISLKKLKISLGRMAFWSVFI